MKTQFALATVGRILATLALSGAVLQCAFAQPTVEMKVYAQHVGSNIVYNYEVINNGKANIVSVRLGVKDLNEQQPELTLEPEGDLPQDGIKGPSTWLGQVGNQEDFPGFNFIVWDINSDPNNRIAPGKALKGFSVILPKADANYLTGHFYVIFDDTRDYTGQLQLADITPPTLSVSVTPNTLWPPNKKLVTIAATIATTDDKDPAPEVKLESITVNETLATTDISGVNIGTDDRQFSLIAKRAGTNKAGRIYTITYSATDASGNKATANATVTVPHDQRK